jgi:hypothetical protein
VIFALVEGDMNPVRRFGLMLLGCMILLIGLAYPGVRFADKPVTWMPVALLVCLLLLIIGFAWAYHPVFLGIESTPKRYTVQTTLTVISVILAAYLGYVFFVNMWLLIGGRI